MIMVQVQAALLPIQLPADVPEEVEDGPSTWAPATLMAAFSGSWLWPCTVQTVAITWHFSLDLSIMILIKLLKSSACAW